MHLWSITECGLCIVAFGMDNELSIGLICVCAKRFETTTCVCLFGRKQTDFDYDLGTLAQLSSHLATIQMVSVLSRFVFA